MKFFRGCRWLVGLIAGLELFALTPTGCGWTADSHPAKTSKHQTGAESKTPPGKAVPPVETRLPLPGEWEPFIDPEREIFPSLLLASATLKDPLRDEGTAQKAEQTKQKKSPPAGHAKPDDTPEILGDENGLLGVVIASPADGARARIEIKENALMADTVLEAELPLAGRLYRIAPRMDYKYDALNRVRQSQPINVTFSVQVDGKSLGERFITARVHPINDCPYAYQNPDDEKDYVDIAWMFAAYVNEDHPAIPGLLKEAQDTQVVDGFDAYQSHDPGTILLQVFAVWEALRQHNIRYSDIGTTTDESTSLYTLHVRFIEEALVRIARQLRGRQRAAGVGAAADGHRHVPRDGARAHVSRDLSRLRRQAIRLPGNHDARRPGPGKNAPRTGHWRNRRRAR